MPKINLKKSKRPRIPTQAKKLYQDIYQNKRWKALRRWKVRHSPLCERCLALDIITPVQEVHHIIPWQTGRDAEHQERLAFDPDNVMSVCTPCHKILDSKS